MDRQAGGIVLAPGFGIERIVEGSAFHTVNGLGFGPDGRLHVASVMGESIFALDVATDVVAVAVGPPLGESDDLVFTPGGDLIWTALLEGIVRMRSADGTIRDLASGLPGVNSIMLTPDHKRLFVGQVFMGEGLWEIDLAGVKPPRLVTGDTGGLNGAQFGSDGLLYAPSWERGQVVRVDPESGATTVLAAGFQKPGAVRFDRNGRLYVLDDATGELFTLDRDGGHYASRVVARFAPSTDNMTFGPDGLLYVSNMADNSIHAFDPATSAVRLVVAGRLAFPRAIALSTGKGGDVIHIADSCSYRVLDPQTGTLSDVARAVASRLKFPTSVSVGPRHVLLTGEAFGVVQLMDRAGNFVRDVEGFDKPGAAIECGDGSLLVSEPAAGRIVQVSGTKRTVLARGLQMPAALVDAGDGTVLVVEGGAGRLLRIGVPDGAVTVVMEGFAALRSAAVCPDGSIIALDAEEGRLSRIDPASGRQDLVASGLPIGYLRQPYTRSGGVVAGSDGAIYVAADIENALYRIRTVEMA